MPKVDLPDDELAAVKAAIRRTIEGKIRLFHLIGHEP
jgi:hypothetical protein